MNAIWLVIAAILFLTLGYRLYGAFIAAKILALDDSRKTPAVIHDDDRDYVPTNKWILFGHHFAAIAGAGPLIGPTLAAQYGYMPGVLWILIGSVLAGAVHDMVILFASVRHDGLSISEIAKDELGPAAGLVSSFAVLFILIITMAGLALAVVNALFNSPWGTFTVGVTIPIALFVGIYLRWLRIGRIAEATVIGVALIFLGVILGPMVEQSFFAPYFTYSHHQLAIILAVYGFAAATLPVWLLLAPRDYLSTYLKIGVIGALAIGIIFIRPELRMPAFTPFVNGGGPIIPGPVWPFMFITIACGALSGFHAIIGTGTTPKMIHYERDILPIGFGAMVVEGFVALMALIAASSLHPADYFAINTAPAVFQKLGMTIQELPQLSALVGESVAGRAGGAVSLGVGMADIFSKIPFLASISKYLYHFVIMFEALFILTTIDAGTRVGRYLLQELGGKVYKPLGRVNWFPGMIVTSALISLTWGYLVYNGDISTIWPLFGVANQLLAGMALAIGTTLIFRMGKAQYAWTTILPFIFVTVTTLVAGYQNIVIYYLPVGKNLLAVLTGMMMILVSIILVIAIRRWFELMRGNSTPDLDPQS
ncbi:carbon starvation protein A [Desulfitobacterium sp.]|uniref:carbon starvation CstA family protein n=1 Tax=Desulfitobacterium sp. TaxID=49981 RepID=UPI002B1F8D34|nr:carbon starvation protein A [Desulfitobacterium sp.]MEA4901950.1 carbon starvation protein A [Desulfitobacterium sp.]